MNSPRTRPLGLLGMIAGALCIGPAMSGKSNYPISAATSASYPPIAHFLRSSNSPAAYGLSRECAKQRRKNKLRRLGVAGDRR